MSKLFFAHIFVKSGPLTSTKTKITTGTFYT